MMRTKRVDGSVSCIDAVSGLSLYLSISSDLRRLL